MKKALLALCMMVGGVVYVNAQVQDSTSTDTQSQTEQTQPQVTPTDDQQRQEIQVSVLPEAVRSSLESQDYSGWTVSTAYRSTQTDSSDETKSMEVYIVELKNGSETKSIHFDKDGNKLKDDNDDDQK